jgi:hypothetical protein
VRHGRADAAATPGRGVRRDGCSSEQGRSSEGDEEPALDHPRTAGEAERCGQIRADADNGDRSEERRSSKRVHPTGGSADFRARRTVAATKEHECTRGEGNRAAEEDPPDDARLGEGVHRDRGTRASESCRADGKEPSADEPGRGSTRVANVKASHCGKPHEQRTVLDRVPSPEPAPPELAIGPVRATSQTRGQEHHADEGERSRSAARDGRGRCDDDCSEAAVQKRRVVEHRRVLEDRREPSTVKRRKRLRAERPRHHERCEKHSEHGGGRTHLHRPPRTRAGGPQSEHRVPQEERARHPAPKAGEPVGRR